VRGRGVGAGVLGALLVAALPARADGLSGVETQRLLRGEAVARNQTVDFADHRYVGGVSYVIVDEPADAVAHLLDDVRVWQRILPKTRSVRAVGVVGQDTFVELTSGTAFLQVTYTMRVRREADGVRFWLDRSKRHDFDDAWGFLRLEPMADGRSLATYGVLIDVGQGIAQDIFAGPVRDLAMSVPDQLRGFVLERMAAGQRASR